MASAGGQHGPTPERIFQTINGYQKSAAMKTAIEIELFTAVSEGANTPAKLGARCGVAERGARILADYLVIEGFLSKNGHGYELTPDSAVFLDKKSKAYLGSMVDFLLNPRALSTVEALTDIVRKGGRPFEESTLGTEDEVWMKFAKAMMPMMYPMAQMVATKVQLPQDRTAKILDIAASHGMFGIQVALANPRSHLVALDWKNVLEVTKENAKRFGVDGRFSTIAGSAFDMDFGGGYDLILIPNFLHHFDIPTCEKFLKKCNDNLVAGGSVAIVEFVPNEDRVTPPMAAAFSMVMLSSTPSGDAYTEKQYRSMLANSGFTKADIHPLSPMPETLVVGTK